MVSELGIRIAILSGIQDSFSCITYSKAQDFGLQSSRIQVSGFPYMGRKLYLGDGYSSLMVYGQVARNPSHVARNAELIGSKFYHASTISYPILSICCACFVSSKIIEREMLLIHRACFVANPELKIEIYYTFISLVSSHHRLRTRYVTHSFRLFRIMMVKRTRYSHTHSLFN